MLVQSAHRPGWRASGNTPSGCNDAGHRLGLPSKQTKNTERMGGNGDAGAHVESNPPPPKKRDILSACAILFISRHGPSQSPSLILHIRIAWVPRKGGMAKYVPHAREEVTTGPRGRPAQGARWTCKTDKMASCQGARRVAVACWPREQNGRDAGQAKEERKSKHGSSSAHRDRTWRDALQPI